MDVRTPGVVGCQPVSMLRKARRSRLTPIIFLAAGGRTPEAETRGYAEGAIDYLMKPVDPDVLRAKVSTLVEMFLQREELKRHAANLEEAVRRGEQETEHYYQFLAELVPQIVWTARADGVIDHYNQRWFEYTGLDLQRLAGRPGLGPALHQEDARVADERWQQAVHSGATYEIQCRLKRAADDSHRWHLVRALPLRDPGGRTLRWFGTFTDIHDQKRAEQSAQVLAEVSRVLLSSIDYESTLKAVANLLVPEVADWCRIDLLREDATVERVAAAHADPAKVKLALEIASRYPPQPGGAAGISKVMRTRRVEWMANVS